MSQSMRQYARDETECKKQYVIDSSRVESRTAKACGVSLVYRDIFASLRGRIKSLFTYCFIILRRRKPIILNNSIRIQI